MRDVIVVGGGPAGLWLASGLARAGLDVVLFDERSQIGRRKICTGIIGVEAFQRFELPRQSILNEIQRLRFFSPKGRRLDYAHRDVLAYVVDRSAFDRSLAELAESSGAELRSSVLVQQIEQADEFVRVRTRRAGDRGGTAETSSARVLALATGVNFRLNRMAGLGVPVDFLNAVQAHVKVSGLDRTHCFAGREVAPGAFAWMVPLTPGLARIGLMAEGNAKSYFRRLVQRASPWLAEPAESIKPNYKPIAQRFEGRSYGHRVIAVGEAAGQVKTTTGGGIYYGLLGADAGRKTLREAFAEDSFDETSLKRYEQCWKCEIAAELEAGYRYRKLFSRLSDGKIEALFKLAQHNGVIPLVRRKATFDWHSRVLSALSNHGIIPKILGI